MGVDLLKWCRAAGHCGLIPLLRPKVCDMSNNQQIPSARLLTALAHRRSWSEQPRGRRLALRRKTAEHLNYLPWSLNIQI